MNPARGGTLCKYYLLRAGIKFGFMILLSSFLFSQEPVDLNTATLKELRAVPGMSRVLAARIIKYRDKTGSFKALDELLKIEGMDEGKLEELSRYVDVKSEPAYEQPYLMMEDSEDETGLAPSAPDYEDLDHLRLQPMDLNSALLDDLMLLPGIDSALARSIIRYRIKVGQFSSADDLLELDGMTRKMLDEIRPFVTVKEEEVKEEFHGDFRIRFNMNLPTKDPYFDVNGKFQHPNYFYSRFTIKYGDRIQVGWITKRDDRGIPITYENFRKYLLVKNYIRMNDVLGVSKIIVGNYQLAFAQGYIFGVPPFLVIPVPYKPRGIQEDRGTTYNNYFQGIALEKDLADYRFYFFLSAKPMVSNLNEDGSVRTDLVGLHQSFITLIDSDNEDTIDNYNNLTENIVGGRAEATFEGATLGVTGYSSEFSRVIDPSKDIYVFNGDRRNALGLDLQYPLNTRTDLFMEYGTLQYHGFTKEDGVRKWFWDDAKAFMVMPVFRFSPISMWINYHRIDPDYYLEHSDPWVTIDAKVSVLPGYPANEEGTNTGVRYEGRGLKTQLE
ncbi:MAG TPA: helix-hairpin-helix domain-containing protein, partial [bacterium]|nr:helix-hairpin-helix domain-containing protein [bacterium]